jgi:DNA topoisomerase-1
MKRSLYTHQECARIANHASLTYVTDFSQGITRKRRGKGFTYYNEEGIKITDLNILRRIQSLAIPPAYHDVWISPCENSHILASGRDKRQRKQYRYHPLWEKIRGRHKFSQMLQFGKMLPLIREQVEFELNQPVTLRKSQLIAVILYLLDKSSIRIGNSIYAKENKTYGVTTLRKKHVNLQAHRVALTFEGKNAKLWRVNLMDKRIIKILKRCVQLSGYELFKYLEGGQQRLLMAKDVTAYLREVTQYPFSAKDFRTWSACRETLVRIIQLIISGEEPTPHVIKETISTVANRLGHTVKICQKSYIHPLMLEYWQNGQLGKWVKNEKNTIIKMQDDELLLYWLEAIRT